MRAATRWRSLVRNRLAEAESIQPGRGSIGPAFWDSRAKSFAKAVDGTAERDPFLRRVRREVDRRTTVLDVGCGPGRFALALAPRAAEVVAVDWSQAMIGLVAARARRAGLANVTCVAGRWEDVEVPPADISICSYVLPIADDPEVFLAKLDASTRRRSFVYLGAAPADLVLDPLWRHFHGTPRRPGPSYLDAVAVLADLGIKATVEIVEVPVRGRYKSVAHAARAYRDTLLVPDTADGRRELRRLLTDWLVADGDLLRPPVRSLPAAIMHWGPGRRTKPRQ
ncbi:MAG: class I SAM-dependent methyltransferase [Acidimicrobiales bacterium]